MSTFSLNCCCEAGCCEDQIIDGATVLVAELTRDDTGCFTLGNAMCMDDGISTGIWTSFGCFGPGFFGRAGWQGLALVCSVDHLALRWDAQNLCPSLDTGANWRLVSGRCNPLEFVFEFDIREALSGFAPACNCDGSTSIPGTAIGTVQVTITKL